MALSRDELRAELKRLRDLAASNGEWTMAQDAKLQSVMEGFRARLAQRTTEVAAAVSNHDQQIERAHARLCNVCNEFDLLSHTQFMEHRVYDDGEAPADAPSASAEEAPPADAAEPTDATLVKECAGLVQVGVRATAAFPADADDAADGPVSEFSYPELALPFVIGTPEFLADDLCGLFAADGDRGMTASSFCSAAESEASGAVTSEQESDGDDDDDDDDSDGDDESESSEEEAA